MEIPEEAFTPIIQELTRRPIGLNHYRKRAGDGRSLAWGVVGKRCLAPDYSRNCWVRPYLYKLLLDFADKYVDIPYTSITVNQNYQAIPHYDRNNVGDSYLVAFGDYTGGNLVIHEGDKEGVHDIRNKPVVADFSQILHSVQNFSGHRFSLVFYTYYDPRWTYDLPPPSVVEVNGQWVFKRGDQLITKQEGMPHPLKGRSKIDAPG